MRFIDPDNVKAAIEEYDSAWFDRAEQAFEEVKTLVDEGADKKAISDAIKASSSIWRELKDVLKEVGHKKCWYCESRDDRSDNAVDHYRPKNRVAECGDEHPGYWWLAFAWENYRYACTYCNSRRKDQEGGTAGGKHDHFPIWDETRRSSDCNSSEEIDEEQPLLLDPARQSDPTLSLVR